MSLSHIPVYVPIHVYFLLHDDAICAVLAGVGIDSSVGTSYYGSSDNGSSSSSSGNIGDGDGLINNCV